jgi:hypothetical protein
VALQLSNHACSCKRAEHNPTIGIKPFGCFYKSEGCHLDKVIVSLTSIRETPGQVMRQTQMGGDKLVSQLPLSKGGGGALRISTIYRRHLIRHLALAPCCFFNQATDRPFWTS